MDFVQRFFSDPVWNGIQGMITLIMFLIFLWEKKENWLPVIKKMGIPFKFAAVTIVFILAGWVMPTIFCFVPLIFAIVASQDLPTAADYAQHFQQSVALLPQFLLLMATAPSIASMTSTEKKLSEQRTIAAGIICGAATILYGFFTGLWSEFFDLIIQGQPNSISPFGFTVFAFIGVILNMVSWLLSAILIGLLAHEGVYRLRNMLGSSQFRSDGA